MRHHACEAAKSVFASVDASSTAMLEAVPCSVDGSRVFDDDEDADDVDTVDDDASDS